MKPFTAPTRFLAAAVLATGGLTALGATVSPASAGCVPSDTYSILSHAGYFMWDGHTYYKDGPGGTMNVSVESSSTISNSVTATGSYSVSDIISEIKIEVSSNTTSSTTTTTGHAYSRNVTAGRYGNLKYGSWGNRVHWARYERTPQCTTVTLASGWINAPTTAVGWDYWETTS